MKSLILTLSLLIFGGTLLAATSLDLTPVPAYAAGDGMEQPVVLFRQGKGCVALLQMAKWSAAGSASSVTFSSQDVAQASLQVSLVPKPLLLDDPAAGETVKKMLLATVPHEAVDVKIATQERDALGINGWKSVDAQVTFNFFGNVMHRSLSLWSQAPDRQLQVVVSSFDRDYAEIGKTAFRFLRTWSDVPPQEMSNFRFNLNSN